MLFKLIFEFLTFGGVFLGVKNNSKNSGNKKNKRLFSKILSKWNLLYSKSSNFLEFLLICLFKNVKSHNNQYSYLHKSIEIDFVYQKNAENFVFL